MKPMQLAEDIVPIDELKTRSRQVLRRLKRARRPVVLTDKGRAAAVLIAPEEFDRLRERAEFIAAVREGLEDSKAGRLIDDDDLGRELDRELGVSKRR